MKRITSMLLAALLLVSMAIPASAAEEGADQRLAEVAAKVKSALGIGDGYEEFYGELRENELAPMWSLNWSREADSISVEATEGGKVTSYYFYENSDTYVSDRNFPPAFPATTREQAQRSAEAFLKKVLDTQETVQFAERYTGRLNTETHRFSGEILLSGLSSPMSFSITVRASDGKVTRFYRDCLEGSFIGGVPSAKPAASQDDAGALLKDTLALRLEYVLVGSEAVLRYLPERGDEYYVDAQTGKLVNLTELYAAVSKGEGAANSGGASFGTADSTAASAEAAQDTGGLTQVELEGISKMEGVLSKEDLDKKMRAVSQLGLGKYALATASYSLDRETDEVTACLTYTRRGEDGTWRRTVFCDARTGALQEVRSSAPYTEDRTASVSESAARAAGEAFLAELWGDDFAKAGLYDSSPWEEKGWGASHSFIYAQKENGYFLPENLMQVSVDVTDGSISGLYRIWTDDVTFDSPEGILDESAALDAWFDHYNVALAYGNIPVKLNPDMADAAPLLEMGFSYFYSLKLIYALEEPENLWASGVDAKTGEIVGEEAVYTESSIAYNDLEGHWAKAQIEALARYGIGWTGEACQPRDKLQQIDFVALLASADGYIYVPGEDAADSLYRRAYSLGILTAGQRNDEKILTRGEVVRMLLDCGGYGDVAGLSGIFTCSFADKDQIPADLLGYAALAQGLGIVSPEGSFDAGAAATRAEAAVMLYNFMNR